MADATPYGYREATESQGDTLGVRPLGVRLRLRVYALFAVCFYLFCSLAIWNCCSIIVNN
jgi:hypothetical protein